MSRAKLVLTDSGGIREETRVQMSEVRSQKSEGGKTERGRIPALWDGATAKRIADILAVATA
jgi:UDP-N-acetylglucosamine 2-epimerase